MNVLLAATHSNSFTTCGLRGQGPVMVNVLLADSPVTRSRPRGRLRATGARTGERSLACSQPSKRVRAAAKRSEVVNELLGWPKERSPALGPGPLVTRAAMSQQHAIDSRGRWRDRRRHAEQQQQLLTVRGDHIRRSSRHKTQNTVCPLEPHLRSLTFF